MRCNAVAPGPIETPLLNGAAADYGETGSRLKQMMIDATAMGRIGTPGGSRGRHRLPRLRRRVLHHRPHRRRQRRDVDVVIDFR